MTLDDAYAGKQEISDYLIEHLQDTFTKFGYTLLSVLITEIEPDRKVMTAMNEINSSRRLKEAAVQRAEGERELGGREFGEARACGHRHYYVSGVCLINPWVEKASETSLMGPLCTLKNGLCLFPTCMYHLGIREVGSRRVSFRW